MLPAAASRRPPARAPPPRRVSLQAASQSASRERRGRRQDNKLPSGCVRQRAAAHRTLHPCLPSGSWAWACALRPRTAQCLCDGTPHSLPPTPPLHRPPPFSAEHRGRRRSNGGGAAAHQGEVVSPASAVLANEERLSRHVGRGGLAWRTAAAHPGCSPACPPLQVLSGRVCGAERAPRCAGRGELAARQLQVRGWRRAGAVNREAGLPALAEGSSRAVLCTLHPGSCRAAAAVCRP